MHSFQYSTRVWRTGGQTDLPQQYRAVHADRDKNKNKNSKLKCFNSAITVADTADNMMNNVELQPQITSVSFIF